MSCLTCSKTVVVAAPLVVVALIIVLSGGVVAYNHDAIEAHFVAHKERLFVIMNHATMVVSGVPKYPSARQEDAFKPNESAKTRPLQ